MRFSVNFDNLASGASADTFATIAALIAADTLGHRCRLRALTLGPADDAPVDLNLAVQIKRVDDVSGGGAGTKGSSPTPMPLDSESRAAVITAGTGYTVEPTTYGDPLFQADMNRRNTILKEWSEEAAPVIHRDQLLGLLVAPRTAAAAVISGCLEFEEF